MDLFIVAYLSAGLVISLLALPDIRSVVQIELSKINKQDDKSRLREGVILLFLLFVITWLPAIIINIVKKL